jgi:hypothetical protein
MTAHLTGAETGMSKDVSCVSFLPLALGLWSLLLRLFLELLKELLRIETKTQDQRPKAKDLILNDDMTPDPALLYSVPWQEKLNRRGVLRSASCR